jgi:hypothetical protein
MSVPPAPPLGRRLDPIVRLPAHPYERVVAVRQATKAYARVIAKDRNRTPGRDFNLIAAFDPELPGI